MGKITTTHELAKMINCQFGYTEKTEKKINNGTVMAVKRFTIKPGVKVFVVEDVLITGITTAATIVALREQGAKILPMVGVLVNRSHKKKTVGAYKITALINYPLTIYQPHEYPHCAIFSPALRPKENWELFHQIQNS